MPRYIDYLEDYRFDLGHVLQNSHGSHRLHFNSSCRITKYVEFVMVKYHVNNSKAFSDIAKLVIGKLSSRSQILIYEESY